MFTLHLIYKLCGQPCGHMSICLDGGVILSLRWKLHRFIDWFTKYLYNIIHHYI